MLNIPKIQLNYNNFSKVAYRKSNNYNTGNLIHNADCFDRVTFRGTSIKNAEKHTINNYTGCIIGGAIGDAFGFPIEFMKLNKIKRQFGENGLQELLTNETGRAKFTDDTQLTIFTADGLLKSAAIGFDSSKIPDLRIIHNSYKDWYSICALAKTVNNGWISGLSELYGTGGSGKICMSALSQDKMGTLEEPLNQGRGCGGVMRVAPVGLMYYENPKIAFDIAARCAAITHGHPDATLSAGVYAAIIANIIQGKNIEESVDNAVSILGEQKDNEHLLELIGKAKDLSKQDTKPEDAIKILGKGWTGDEAIAISIYCALKSPNDYKKAVVYAINHSGDSDSVGSIVGGIMGAYLGYKNIPSKYREKMELTAELKQLSKDLFTNPKHGRELKDRYPTNLSTLQNAQMCDTISFGGTMNKLPLYYKHAGENYEPETDQEKAFAEALKDFSELENRHYSQEQLRAKSISLSTAYEDLMINILDSDENDTSADKRRVYLFTSLVEALDKAKTPEVASSLNGYLFHNFMENYDGEQYLLNPLKVYAESNILTRPPVKMSFERLYKKWQ